MNKRRIFAVVTARASAPEQRQLLDGIISEAFRNNTDIVIISNIYNASEYNSFIVNENSIYEIIRNSRTDGIIFTSDSFMNKELTDKITEIMNLSGVPVVNIGADSYGYDTVNDDTSEDICRITEHLINVHGFRNIDILTGPEDNHEALRRVEGYRKALENNGIEFSSEHVIYGNFWTEAGEKTALEYAENKRKIPEAVVCANDYMAYALCDTLVKCGIKIPQDITVTGYEYTGGRTDHYPVLTTFQRNRRELGRKAFAKLYSKVCGTENNFSDTGSDTDNNMLVTGDTCTCGADYRQTAAEIQEKQQQIFYTSLNDTGMLEQFLTESVSIPDFISALRRHSYFIPDISGLYLCLYDEWCLSVRPEKHSEQADTVCYTISDIYRNNPEPCHFSRNDIFPHELQNSEHPGAFYCCPVFFMNEDFGYMIVRYDKVKCFGESFRNWIKIAANALEFLRMKNDINYLMMFQNLSEFRDSETGLSNRAGFINEINIALRNKGDRINELCFLKFIPDISVLHSSDKNLISEISQTLEKISGKFGEICGRINNSTFAFSCRTADPEILSEKIKTSLYGIFRNTGIYGDEYFSWHRISDFSSEDDFSDILKKAYSRTEASEEISENSGEYEKYRELRKMIYLNPEKNITADTACRKFCKSRGYFCLMYKKYFGISFHQDCIEMKTKLAKHLLASTEMNISAVSEKCGFENEKYFMQQFKKNTGYTPGQYRELISL